MRNGVEVADYVDQLAAVLADGRVVITTTHPNGFGTDYILLDPNGKELSRLQADEQPTGTVKLAPDATTVSGNRAYVGVLHTLQEGTREIVVYRVNETNTWRLLRRAAVDTFGDVQLVISDGTVFVRDKDPNGNSEPRIRAFLVDGTVYVAWREGSAKSVREHIGNELLTGPAVPSGTSLQTPQGRRNNGRNPPSANFVSTFSKRL